MKQSTRQSSRTFLVSRWNYPENFMRIRSRVFPNGANRQTNYQQKQTNMERWKYNFRRSGMVIMMIIINRCSIWAYVNDDTCVIVYRKFQLYWCMGVGIFTYIYPSPCISIITSKWEFMKEYSPSNFKMNLNNSSGYMHRYALLRCICVALIFNYVAFLCSSVCVFIVLLFVLCLD